MQEPFVQANEERCALKERPYICRIFNGRVSDINLENSISVAEGALDVCSVRDSRYSNAAGATYTRALLPMADGHVGCCCCGGGGNDCIHAAEVV